MASRNGIIPIIAFNNVMSGYNPRGLDMTVDEVVGFVFSHSLFTFGLSVDPVSTATGEWLGDIATGSGNTFAMNGQLGQMRDQQIPPNQDGQIGYQRNSFDPWPESPPIIPFIDADFRYCIVMASNFEQPVKTPSQFVDETEPVLDFIVSDAPLGQIIIYEHWPEAAGYGLTVFNGNEMSPSEFTQYNQLTSQGGSYHTWHLQYQDEMTNRGYSVRMIPVGPVIADLLLNESYMSTVTHADIYADDSPHGFPTVYFLAGLICYRALFRQNPSPSYIPSVANPVIIPEVLNNLSSIISYIETRLDFYAANGVNVYDLS